VFLWWILKCFVLVVDKVCILLPCSCGGFIDYCRVPVVDLEMVLFLWWIFILLSLLPFSCGGCLYYCRVPVVDLEMVLSLWWIFILLSLLPFSCGGS